jgi:pimeloyl-ACP methyl ester carboxylesterase
MDTFVLVHGSTGGAGHWLQVAPALADRFDVVTPEYAQEDGPPVSVDDLVGEILKQVDAERFHLAGWSLGSVVAAAVAAAAPDRVQSLALVSSWARTDARMRFTFDLWRQLLHTDPELFARYTFADGLTAASFELFGDGVHALVPVTAGMFVPGSDRHLELDMQVDITDRLGSISAPTLVVGGREDRWVDVAHSRALADQIPGARLVELDCGHLIPTERAAELVDLLVAHAS